MLRRLIVALLLLLAPLAAHAQADDAMLAQRAQDIVAVLRGERPATEVFTAEFNAAVPPAQLAALAAQIIAQYGPLTGVEDVRAEGPRGGANLALRFQYAIGRGAFQLEARPPYRVAGFRLTGSEPLADQSVPVTAQLAALPGTTNLLFTRLDGSVPILAHNADQPLAIGSTFKLYVLAALTQAVADGRLHWDDVVVLSERSFPSGMVQDWPQGTPVTVQTLATLMIAISDNTATDQLIALLGREAVEAELIASGHADPARTLPLMTTREMFVMKAGDAALLARYPRLREGEQREVLASLAEAQTTTAAIQAAFGSGPRAIDVEWFASPQDLAALMARLADDPVARAILGVNTGQLTQDRANWPFIGFKGGSEPGVLNLTWLLRDADGADYLLSLGWNNPHAAVIEPQLLGLAQAALAEAHLAQAARE